MTVSRIDDVRALLAMVALVGLFIAIPVIMVVIFHYVHDIQVAIELLKYVLALIYPVPTAIIMYVLGGKNGEKKIEMMYDFILKNIESMLNEYERRRSGSVAPGGVPR